MNNEDSMKTEYMGFEAVLLQKKKSENFLIWGICCVGDLESMFFPQIQMHLGKHPLALTALICTSLLGVLGKTGRAAGAALGFR